LFIWIDNIIIIIIIIKTSNPTLSEEDFGFSTRAVHVGQEPDPVTGAVIPSISLSTTFKQSAAGVNTVSFFFFFYLKKKKKNSIYTFIYNIYINK